MSADGVAGKEIPNRVGISPEYVSRIRRRFEEIGVTGLTERPRAAHCNLDPTPFLWTRTERK
jgi:hypothetical protein